MSWPRPSDPVVRQWDRQWRRVPWPVYAACVLAIVRFACAISQEP